MPSARDIKRRIKSINNTKKVTGAMEMVAAAKMRRAVEAVLKTRRYANLSWATVLNLARASGGNGLMPHPLLERRPEEKKVVIVLISSNRGLCGAFNSAIIKKAHDSIVRHPGRDGRPKQTEFMLLGRKGFSIYKYYKYDVVADFPKEDLIRSVSDIVGVAKILREDYTSRKYDKVFVAYTDFVSASKQEARVRQILPIDEQAHKDFLGTIGPASEQNGKDIAATEYIFEPSPRGVLDEMIPRLIEVQLFQAALESSASEHSARMAAMRQATEAAGELVEELTLFYNKARQSSITREIAEISAGANALK